MLPALLMVVGLISYNSYKDRLALTQGSLATARAMMSAVDREVAGVQAGLFALATSPHLVTNDLSAFYDQAKIVLKNQNARNIFLVDPTFQQVVNTLRPYGSELPSEARHPSITQIFKTGLPVTTDLLIGGVSKVPLIVVAVPVRRDGGVPYVLAASIRPEQLVLLLTQQRLSADWIGVIFDSTGTIIARTHQMERFLGMKGTSAVIARIAETEEDTIEVISVEGIPILSVFSRSTVLNWTVAIGIPSIILTRDLWNTLLWLVGGTAVLLLSSLAVAWAIGSRIAGPIRQLAAPALALGSGEEVIVPSLRLREADEVGKALTRASAMLMAAHHRANHDVLTGLANRALFDEILTHQLAICERNQTNLSIVCVDLDGFKAVNDVHGHANGDGVLCAVAARLQQAIRASDLAARMGGDEFALILINAGADAAETVAAKLIDSLAAPYHLGLLTLDLSASIGIATYPESGATSEALLLRADDAMYKAKSMGKRCYALAS